MACAKENPPINYSAVEPGCIYRSGFPTPFNFPFLRRLSLRSILCLSPKLLEKGADGFPLVEFCAEEGIALRGAEVGDNQEPFIEMDAGQIAAAVAFLINPANQPVLVCCLAGGSRTGCTVACVRRRQQWALTATLDEFSRFLGHGKSNLLDFQFIESFE
jgi:tyrosine-protein phosphatase SIW14